MRSADVSRDLPPYRNPFAPLNIGSVMRLLLIAWVALVALPVAAQGVTVEAGGQVTLQNSGQMATITDLTVKGTFAANPGTLVRFEGRGWPCW